MPKTVIFDYGVGNLLSLKIALEKSGFNVNITVSPQQLSKADAIALPGVGNFSAAVVKLDPIKEQLLDAVQSGTPLIGICLGLQLFFTESEEGPGEGLSLFEGKSVRLRGSMKVPHMGWNTLQIVKKSKFFEDIEDNAYVYFVHSHYPIPVDKSILAAETEYGTKFPSAIATKNIFGTQFHPEKSGETGLRILKNFANVVKR